MSDKKFLDDGEGLVFETDDGEVTIAWLEADDDGNVSEDEDDEEDTADAQKSAGPDQESQSLTEEEATLFHMLWPDRVELDDARARLERSLQRALARQGRLVVAAVRSRLETVSKADEPETLPAGAVALAAMETEVVTVALGALGSWDFVIDGVSDALEEAAEDATRQAVAAIGPSAPDDLFDQVSERSVRMAEERAAELVGRRVLADGSIIDNPNPQWAISESTRDMIRTRIQSVIRGNEGSDALIEALETDHAFSPARARMVARTEIADINSRAQMETYRVAEDAGVDVRKRWVLGPRPCETCIANAAEGAIPLDQPFQSGDDTAPAHPNCVCAVTPEVS
jgi:hypothetical protein